MQEYICTGQHYRSHQDWWLLARDEGADPGAIVPRVGQGGQASCGGPVRGGQGVGAGRVGVLPAGVSPPAAMIAVAGYRRPSLGCL